MTRIFHWFFMWKIDPMSGFDIRLVFTLPPREVHCSTKDVYTFLALHPWKNRINLLLFVKSELELTKSWYQSNIKFNCLVLVNLQPYIVIHRDTSWYIVIHRDTSATNSDFIIPLSLQPNVVDLRYLKLYEFC